MHAEAIVSGGRRGAFNKKPVISANISVSLKDYYAFAKMMQIQAPRELALYPHALYLWPERHQLLEEGYYCGLSAKRRAQGSLFALLLQRTSFSTKLCGQAQFLIRMSGFRGCAFAAPACCSLVD